MNSKARKHKAWRQIAIVMLLAGAGIGGAVAAPVFQPNSVQITYADDGCDGVNPPPHTDCTDPTPTPTATPTPGEHDR